jgi:hypothetical protein
MPLRMTSIHKMLTNVYYVGIVEYGGRRVTGRHEPLVDRDTFDRVQAHLAARAVAGDRPSKHEHYLRGTLYCAECGGRLLFSINSGNGGSYEYFACINRASRNPQASCRSRHYQAALIEKAIEEHYATVKLTRPSSRRSGTTSSPTPPSGPKRSIGTSVAISALSGS